MRKLFVLLFLGLSACSSDDLPKYVELKGLRIVGLIMSAPEVNPNSAGDFPVTVKPIISDVTETTSISYTAVGCLDPGVGLGQEPTCTGAATAQTLATGTVSALNAARSFTGVANTFTISAAQVSGALTFFGTLSAADQFNGINYLITYTVTNSAGTSVKSFKRLLLSTRTTKNQNPTVSDILRNGSSFVALVLGSKIDLVPSITVGAESYSVQKSDGTFSSRTEELTTTWFITDGSMKRYRTLSSDSNEFENPSAQPAGRDVFMITVTRDGRGGTASLLKCFGTCAGVTSGPL